MSCPAFQDPIDSGWLLTCAMRIMTMQSGFALLESAFTRKNNQGSLMLKNTLDLVAGVFAYYYVGYGLAFGERAQAYPAQGVYEGGHLRHIVRVLLGPIVPKDNGATKVM